MTAEQPEIIVIKGFENRRAGRYTAVAYQHVTAFFWWSLVLHRTRSKGLAGYGAARSIYLSNHSVCLAGVSNFHLGVETNPAS